VPASEQIIDVAIVGAGPAGLGLAITLQRIGAARVGVLESRTVGASFLRWPAETRFITPSFYGNPFGLVDLNAITPTTSPADLLGEQHVSGPHYAEYLRALATHHKLQIAENCAVTALARRPDRLFHLLTTRGPLLARNVVWATGEFHHPDHTRFAGADLCQHYAEVAAFADLAGDERVIIGGFESALDAACHLVANGRRVRVLSPRPTWLLPDEADPSVILTPHTRGRVEAALATGRLELIDGARITRVAPTSESASGFLITAEDGRTWQTAHPPINATGFRKGGGARQIEPLFAWNEENGFPLLTPDDESTLTPGLFLVGPHVRHEKIIFCFIYKFRQRFAVVARALADRLDLDAAPLEELRPKGFFLDDLSCCLATCEC
jgi:cation diffusion facilitator CzcD-associated flavoprotein CzcO